MRMNNFPKAISFAISLRPLRQSQINPKYHPFTTMFERYHLAPSYLSCTLGRDSFTHFLIKKEQQHVFEVLVNNQCIWKALSRV